MGLACPRCPRQWRSRPPLLQRFIMTVRTFDQPIRLIALKEPSVDGPGLRTVLLSPWGEVVSKNGTYQMDADAAARIIQDFTEHGSSLPIDIEHETLPEFTPSAGSRGAIGWIENVYADEG